MNQVKLYREKDQTTFVKECLSQSFIKLLTGLAATLPPSSALNSIGSALRGSLRRPPSFCRSLVFMLADIKSINQPKKHDKVGGSYEETVTASSQDQAG